MACLRTQNWLRELDRLPAAQAAGASLLRICPTDDPVAQEVEEEIGVRGLICERVDCWVCVRVAAGDAVYVEQESIENKIEHAIQLLREAGLI
jgi:hypothetical protein